LSDCGSRRRAAAEIEPAFLQSTIDAYRDGATDCVNSILADRLEGRPMEIDARNGVIIRLAAKHAIPTPLNAFAVALLEAAQAATGSSPCGK
jgi:2-dehydropantoate 2-reductase